MNSQYSKTDTDTTDENQCQYISTTTISSTHHYPLALPLFPSQVSHIKNLRPSADQYEDEQHIAHLLNRHFALNSSGTLAKAKTITQPTFIPVFQMLNETSVHANQIRRSNESHPYEYKPSINMKQIPVATLYPTELALNVFDEETQGTPIFVNHVQQQQSKGIRKIPNFISQLNTRTSYAEDFDESAIQLDQLHRAGLAHPIKYKILRDVQPSIGSVRQMPSVFIQEELSQEPSININLLRQANIQQNLRSLNAAKQQVTFVLQPCISTNLDPIDETAFRLSQFHRPFAPQNIQYKAPIGIQPSIGSIIRNNSTLTEDESFGEAPLILNQLRQRQAQVIKQQTASI